MEGGAQELEGIFLLGFNLGKVITKESILFWKVSKEYWSEMLQKCIIQKSSERLFFQNIQKGFSKKMDGVRFMR